ncbi:hypothetical protein ABZZ79_34025 [Streptomyces sp. NPDC006458]|uniref:hypothetical protein n=1 Tax=Streptomyces sp. NPDC006458 TaxID=3154302 RepID=UPI0033B2BEBE
METARTPGLRDAMAMTRFNLLGHFVALFGTRPDQLRAEPTGTRDAACCWRRARRIPIRRAKALSNALFNTEATLFHCELTDQPPRRRSPGRADDSEGAMRRRESSAARSAGSAEDLVVLGHRDGDVRGPLEIGTGWGKGVC